MSDRTKTPWWIGAAARLLRPVLDEVARQRVAERTASLTVIPFVDRLRRIEPTHRLPVRRRGNGPVTWDGTRWMPPTSGDAA